MMEESLGRLDRSRDIDFRVAAANNGVALATAASAVAVIDTSRLRRECLKLALAHYSPQWQIAEFASADEVLRLVEAGEHFDLVLLGAATAEHIDIRQIEALRQACPEVPAVIVAESGNPQRARQILNAGARGFLPASLSVKVVMGALDLVLAGGVYVPSTLIDTAAPRPSEREPQADHRAEPWSELTRRQRDVLVLISQGKSNKLIADALAMSESTVKAHVKQIIKRLHVSNRTQAALLATGNGSFLPATRELSPSL
ncbi:MAG TPA: response regulator transcription factor [Stellaceae bacterium]|nr:response regulator transcription factor [Stellaceae bacterium]